MENEDGEKEAECEVAELRLKADSLKQELRECRVELAKLQKQLNQSERLQKSTESYNEDLRKQVDQLSAEIHERKKKDKDRVNSETQTEENVWTETDYYNYYYGSYSQNTESADPQEGLNAAAAAVVVAAEASEASAAEVSAVDGADQSKAAEVSTPNETEAADESAQPNSSVTVATEEGDAGSIADMLRATAEEAMTQTGFVFDETTGMYYDHSTGFYYDSASQLYYDANTGIYYYCEAESGRYQFHSRIEVPAAQTDVEPCSDMYTAEKKSRKLKKGLKKTSHKDDKVQEVTSSLAKMKISSRWKVAAHRVNANIWPPCVRVTVVRSPVLQVGTLFIITADSPATIGREKDMDHAIRIPEMGVSKLHAEVHFDQEQQSYALVDQGSQNGTVINGNRILQPKAICEPQVLMHGDEVKMGETVLSFHIHSGTDTCDGCEPGQVMAHLSKHKREENTGPALTKEDKEALRQKELKQMKAKYGLQSNEETKALKNPKYQDRAESRRQTVGSEGVFQRDDAPASVHKEISEVNKGRKMLEKMGWKKGEGLGKGGTGMKNPIELKIRKSQSGLGAGAAMSLDSVSTTKSKSQKNWEKARERFADTFEPDASVVKTQSNSPKAWVRAEETETTNSQTDSQS
ncbi:angiogenic factor with G patch and FHA domains 1 isoform X4 [Hippoglossus hippoglossus]|uniref:angiogenic factor with G patch and FHA domains 1 isoform X4 n=1 Tax=Hippoglossus hippoglossus TaxID=8267 RepID=UPI00148C8126|nr:angiogenic factor with G patch and FHA domains 1 isoform X4 [Hippoglossus hippoglossus]